MCRIDERVYISADGSRQTFEDPFLCSKSRHGRMCSSIDRRRKEYFPRPPPVTRDSSTSPASFNPPTPTGTGSYLVQARRPSIVERRPSTREGPRPLKPEIIIEFGPRKDKTKKYPAISVKTKNYKRSSLGASSIGSNDIAIESPGSDASFTVRTGLSETPVPLTHPYTVRPAVPQSHHRHTSSASSFTTSSQPPSLYATSDPDSPTGRRAPRYPPTIVHNPPSFTSSSPTTTRATPVPNSSNSYRTTNAEPQGFTPRGTIGPDGLFPVDYSSFHSNSGSSHASSSRAAAPEITDRDAERARLRQLNLEGERRRQQEQAQQQQEIDRQIAIKLAQEEAQKRAQEEAKQVRFELGRAEGERRRAEDREEARRHKHKEQSARDEKEKSDRLKKDAARKEKQTKEDVRKTRESRPPTRDPTAKRHHSRRPSITRAQAQERDLLLAETEAQMARERAATEQREREERAALLRQQQETPQYWDPRGGDRYPVTNEGVGRRGSVSGRRPSISSVAPPPMGLSRRNSTRGVSIIQPAPPTNLPPLTTTFPSQYATRPASSSRANPPTPLFSPGQSGSTYPRPSARHSSSYSQDNPFAQPPTRTSQDNPFAPAAAAPMPPRVADPWDTRNVREALPQVPPPQVRQPSTLGVEQPHTLKRRGEDVIKRAAEKDRLSHHLTQQATRNLNKATGFEDDYETTDDENEADKILGYGPRLGLANKDKRRN